MEPLKQHADLPQTAEGSDLSTPKRKDSGVISYLKEHGCSMKEKLGIWNWILNKLQIKKWVKIEEPQGLEKAPKVYVKVNVLAKKLHLSETAVLDLREAAMDAKLSRIGERLALPLISAYNNGFNDIVELIKTEKPEDLQAQLIFLQAARKPELKVFATRVLAAYETLQKVGSEALTKKKGVPLSEVAMLKVAIVAESKIALSGELSAEYLKKTDLGIERSLLVDSTTKSWTVVVGDTIGTGTSKKVKTGQLVQVMETVGKNVAVESRELILAVNRMGKTLDQGEVKTAKRFSDDPRGIATVRAFTTYITTKEGERFRKQVIVQEKAIGDLSKGSYVDEGKSRSARSRDEIQGVAQDIAYGLARFHGEGLVHRDIKLENILEFTDGAKLADFGLTRTGSTNSWRYGTITYTAPETLERSIIDSPADIYAFGIVLYELTFSEPPLWFYGLSDLENEMENRSRDQVRIDNLVDKILAQQAGVLVRIAELEANGPYCTEDEKFELKILKMLHPDPTKRPDALECMTLWRARG